jgi:DNA polymerase-4
MPGIGPATARRLASLGLDDVWQVQQMAEAQLARLIGDEARPLKLRAHGWGGTVLRGDRLPRSVSRETTFGSDVRDPDELETMLLLFARACQAARRAAHGAPSRSATARRFHHRPAARSRGDRPDRELFEAVRPLFLTAFVR